MSVFCLYLSVLSLLCVIQIFEYLYFEIYRFIVRCRYNRKQRQDKENGRVIREVMFMQNCEEGINIFKNELRGKFFQEQENRWILGIGQFDVYREYRE